MKRDQTRSVHLRSTPPSLVMSSFSLSKQSKISGCCCNREKSEPGSCHPCDSQGDCGASEAKRDSVVVKLRAGDEDRISDRGNRDAVLEDGPPAAEAEVMAAGYCLMTVHLISLVVACCIVETVIGEMRKWWSERVERTLRGVQRGRGLCEVDVPPGLTTYYLISCHLLE